TICFYPLPLHDALPICFRARSGINATMYHASVYSALMHYFKAVEATGSDDAKTVIAKMRELPVHDFFARNGKLREDGRMVHDMRSEEHTSELQSRFDLV